MGFYCIQAKKKYMRAPKGTDTCLLMYTATKNLLRQIFPSIHPYEVGTLHCSSIGRMQGIDPD